MPVYYYLVKRDFLESYHQNKKKLHEYEKNLYNMYNEYIDFLKKNDFCEEDEYKYNFQSSVEHTSYLLDKFKRVSIEIGYEFWSNNVRLFSFSIKPDEIRDLFSQDYVVVDEYWSDEYVYFDTYEKFLDFLNQKSL